MAADDDIVDGGSFSSVMMPSSGAFSRELIRGMPDSLIHSMAAALRSAAEDMEVGDASLFLPLSKEALSKGGWVVLSFKSLTSAKGSSRLHCAEEIEQSWMLAITDARIIVTSCFS